MKRVISTLVAMLMILSSLSAFAAIEVDLTQPSKSFYNDLSSFADGATVATPFGINTSHPVEYEFKGGQYSVSRKDDSGQSGLTYLNYSEQTTDTFSFGYDVKFSNISAPTGDGLSILSNSPGTPGTVYTDDVMANVASGYYTQDEKGVVYNSKGNAISKTAWCFWATGNPGFTFTMRKSGDDIILGDNGKPAVFLGDAKLEQDAFYTFKVYADQINKKYWALIVDANGNVLETGISGKIQNAFYAFSKIDSSLQEGAGYHGTVTYDNLFCTNSILELRAGDTTNVNSNGTVSFDATLPANLVNPAVYVNNTLVENITLTPGNFEDYNITVALPEGTALGEATFEIRGTINGAAVSVSDTTVLSKTYKTFTKVLDTPNASLTSKGLRAFTSGGKIGVDSTDSGVWTITPTSVVKDDGSTVYTCGGQVDVTDIEPMLTGVVDYSFDFKSNSQITSLRLRMTANTSNGDAMKWNGGADTYHYFENGYPYGMGTKDIAYDSTQWNTLRIRADYYNHKYYAYINGTLCEEGTFTDYDDTWTTTDKEGKVTTHRPTNGVDDVRFIIHCADKETGVIYLDNFKFEEYRLTSNLAAATVAAKYADGSTVAYDDVALDAIDLTGLDFATPVAFDAASIPANTKIVNSAGEVIPATFSFANGTISAAYAGAVLPTDNYKLVVSKNATINGAAVGAAYEVPFALNSDDKSLVEDGTVVTTEKVNLSAFAANATKVVFKVDDETVKTFAAPEADGMYEFLYTPATAGEHVFDAYVYNANGVNLVSSTFNYLVDARMLEGGNDMNSGTPLLAAAAATITYVDGAGKDGSRAAKLVSKEGTIISSTTNDAGETVYTYNTDASNSNTGSFGPGDGLYKVWALEFEIKPEANTYVSTEIGFSLSGQKYSANTAAYRTLSPRGSSPALLAPSGSILGTDKTFTPGTWYKFKQVIDLVNFTCTWYVNDEFLIQDDISKIGSGSASAYPNWKEDIVLTMKYKICVHPITKSLVLPSEEYPEGLPATVYLDNYKRWHPVETPVLEAVTANGAALTNGVIATGTDAVTVALDKDFHALAANNIAVTVDGEAVGTVTVADKKTFTVSGLANVAAGKKIEVRILKNNLSVPFNNNTAAVKSDYVFYIFVGDSNKVCFYPLSVESATGSNLTAYAKYLNGSQSALNTYLIMTEYANDDKTLVRQANFAPVAIAAGKVGAVSGYLGDVVKAEGCNVMLWNTDFAPLLEAGALAQ